VKKGGTFYKRQKKQSRKQLPRKKTMVLDRITNGQKKGEGYHRLYDRRGRQREKKHRFFRAKTMRHRKQKLPKENRKKEKEESVISGS